MIIETIITQGFSENIYILGDKTEKEAILIDPGGNVDEITAKLDELQLTPIRILNTHAHPDHIGAVYPLQSRYHIPFMVHRAEASNVESASQMAQFLGLEGFQSPQLDAFFTEDDIFEINGSQLKVIHTPGHTPGSVSFQIRDYLFSGDTLFMNSIGRTDLPGGSWLDLKHSLERLAKLPSQTQVYPGHGPPTTIGQEIANNPFYQDGEKKI